MQKMFSVKRMFHLLLVLAATITIAAGMPSAAHAEDGKTDIGTSKDIVYLTSYVYKNNGLKGEVRLVDTRDYHMLNEEDVSFSAVSDGNDGYDLTVTALETSEKYTGSYTCKAEYVGTKAPSTKKISNAKGTWKYMPVADDDGWKEFAVVSYTPGTGDTADITELNDYFENSSTIEGEAYYVLPGAFNGAANLKTAILGDVEYEPYMFVNCPNLASINLITEEFIAETKNENDIKPLHLGPIEATNTDADGSTANKIMLTVHRKAKWVYYDEDDNDTDVLTMVAYCSKYAQFYIMETNSKEFQPEDSDWLFRVTFEADGETPAFFTVVKYNPQPGDTDAWNARTLTLPDSVTYRGEEYFMEDGEPYFDLDTNVFDGLPELETIDTGAYLLNAPLANNCPKLKRIVSYCSPDEDIDEEIWQEDCENYGYKKDLKPLVNGDLDSQLTVEMNEDFAWTMAEPKTNAQGQFIDPDGHITDDPDEADGTTYRMSQYCADFGYAFTRIEMKSCRLRINAHDSLTAIAGMGPLKLSIWRSYDSSYYDDEEAEWYTASRFFEYTVSNWNVTGNEDILQYVTLNTTDGTITVDPGLKSAGSVTVSCKVKQQGKITGFDVISKLEVLPVFSAAPGSSRSLYIDESGNTVPEEGMVIPFGMNGYADYGEESEFDGDPEAELCYAQWFMPYINRPFGDDGVDFYEQVPAWEPFHPDNGVTSVVTLEKCEGGREPGEIAELVSTGGNEPFYLIKAKEGAEEGDRFKVKGEFTYNGHTAELTSVIKVMKQRSLSDEEKQMIPEDGTLVIGTFFESQTSNLVNTLYQMYPELQGKIEICEMDEEDWTDHAAAYADYMEGVEDYMFDEEEPDWMPDMIIWPHYMLKGQQGGPAAVSFEDNFTGDDFHRYSGLGNVETSGGQRYAVATSVEPGGFVYNKAVARAVIGSDSPADVQAALGTWEGFVDIMGVMTSGEVKDENGSIMVSSGSGEKYYMLSSLDRLDEAMVQGAGTVDGETIALDGSVLDYMTIRQKIEEDSLLGNEGALTSGKALGRFATEGDTLENATLREGISKGTLGVIRGPATFVGEGTEFATVTAKGAEENSGFIQVVLGLMLKDQTAMGMAYEGDADEEYQGSMFINNSEWQASLDSSTVEGAGIRVAWNAAAADMDLPLEDPVSSYVQTIIAGKWDTDHATSIAAVKDVLNGKYLPVIKAVDENDNGSWGKKQYNINGKFDSDDTKRLDLKVPYEDPETGHVDQAAQARFDKYAAASYEDANEDEVFCYSLTRALEEASADDAPDTATIKLYNDMAYSKGSFAFDDAVIDLNGSSLSGPGSEMQEALLTVSNGGSLKLVNTSNKAATLDGSSGTAVIDAQNGGLDIQLGSNDSVNGHIKLADGNSFSTTACAYDETAATDLVKFAGRKSYIENDSAEDMSGTFAAIAGLITDERFTTETDGVKTHVLIDAAGRDRAANLYVLSDGYEYVPDGPAPEILANECFRIGKPDMLAESDAREALTAAAWNEYKKAVKMDLNEVVDAGRALLSDRTYRVSETGDGSDVRPECKWITGEQKQALEDAIANAVEKMDSDNLSAITTVANAVREAMKAYENATAGTKDHRDKEDVLEDIADALTEASGKKDGVLVSAAGDGSDIDPDQKWVTQEAMDSLDNAIRAATEAADDSTLDVEALDGILTELNRANDAFTPVAGSKPAAQPSKPTTGPSKTQPQPSEITDLPSVKIKSAKAAKKKATVKWKKVSKKNLKKIAKIQIQYSTSRSFNTPDTKAKLVGKKKTSATIKKLGSKKTYFVRIRAYKVSGGKVHVSRWSKIKRVKIK